MDMFNPDLFRKPKFRRDTLTFICEIYITERDSGREVLDGTFYFNGQDQVMASTKAFRYFSMHYNPDKYRINIGTSLPLDR